jgi:hypothetical protein
VEHRYLNRAIAALLETEDVPDHLLGSPVAARVTFVLNCQSPP